MFLALGTYNASHLLLSWESEHPVKVATQLHLTEFSLKSYWTYATNVTSGLSRSAFGKTYHPYQPPPLTFQTYFQWVITVEWFSSFNWKERAATTSWTTTSHQ